MNNILIGIVFLALVVGIFVFFGASGVTEIKEVNLGGKWLCKTAWSFETNGESVPCSAEQEASCDGDVLTSKSVISIGPAQWTETAGGACQISGLELTGTRTTLKTVAMNDAAREFEQDIFKGKTLADVGPDLPQNFRLRITSATETQFEGVNDQGRTIACTRP